MFCIGRASCALCLGRTEVTGGAASSGVKAGGAGVIDWVWRGSSESRYSQEEVTSGNGCGLSLARRPERANERHDCVLRVNKKS